MAALGHHTEAVFLMGFFFVAFSLFFIESKKGKGKETLFIHGNNFLKLQACGVMLVFGDRGKAGVPEKNLSEQGREPANSAHTRHRI